MPIAITGGAGYIGRALIAALSPQDKVIHVLSRQNTSCAETVHSHKFFQADLADPKADFSDFLKNTSVLYHCAGEIHDESKMHALHVDGTQRLLDAVKLNINATQQAFHWVQLSSVGAYGPSSAKPSLPRRVTEEALPQPVGAYEVTKTLSDNMVMAFAEQQPLFTYTILRPSIVISNDMPNQSVRALVSLMRHGLFFYVKNRSSIANYIHKDDVVAALLLCGNHSAARRQVFNLSNDCLYADIVAKVCEASQRKPPTICVPEAPLRLVAFIAGFAPKFMRSPLTKERIDALVRHTSYSSEKLKKLLEFAPKVDIPTSISKMN